MFEKSRQLGYLRQLLLWIGIARREWTKGEEEYHYGIGRETCSLSAITWRISDEEKRARAWPIFWDLVLQYNK